MTARLVAFVPAAGRVVRGWAEASGRFAPWTAPPSEDTFRAALDDPHVSPYLLREGDAPVAYGEIWSEAAPEEVELARIIVDPHARRRGLGSTLTRALIETARARFDAPVWLRVLPDNVAALACYARLGFARASPEEELRFNAEAQSPGMVWLVLGRGQGPPDRDRCADSRRRASGPLPRPGASST